MAHPLPDESDDSPDVDPQGRPALECQAGVDARSVGAPFKARFVHDSPEAALASSLDALGVNIDKSELERSSGSGESVFVIVRNDDRVEAVGEATEGTGEKWAITSEIEVCGNL
jgi:hypothetical protein